MKCLLSYVSCLAVLLASCCVSASSFPGDLQRQQLSSYSQRPIPQGWKKESSTHSFSLDMEGQLEIIMPLKRRNVAHLERTLLDEIANPKSSKFGQHLTHEEMEELISPGQEAIDEILSWLAGHGIGHSQVNIARHQDSLKFRATRVQAASLFNVGFAAYAQEEGGKKGEDRSKSASFITSIGTPSIPQHLAAVIETVSGLDNVPGTKPEKLIITDPRAKKDEEDAVLPTSQSQVDPDSLYKLYNISETKQLLPAGVMNVQSFFQAEMEAVGATDLTAFCKYYMHGSNGTGPYTGPCEISNYVSGKDLPTPQAESALDSEYIIGIGRQETWAYTFDNEHFCHDLLAFAHDFFEEANGTYPYVTSMSYAGQTLQTGCGSTFKRSGEDFMKMGAMGVSVIMASGDSGSGWKPRSGYDNHDHLVPGWPADFPYVTAVGATQFQHGLNRSTEKAAFFSGGGFSWNSSIPEYQTEAVMTYMELLKSNNSLPDSPALYNYQFPSHHHNNTNSSVQAGRATPDLAVVGWNFKVIWQGNEYPISGTSAAAPTVAGMVTLLNNVRLSQGKKKTLGFINPFFYQNQQCFHDITVGSNDNKYPGYGWNAAEGWDASSGLGSPDFGCLLDVLMTLE